MESEQTYNERSANAGSSSLAVHVAAMWIPSSSTLSMDPLRSKKHAVESRVRSVNKSERRSGLTQSSEENEEEMFLVIKTRTRHLNSDRERKERKETEKGKEWREALPVVQLLYRSSIPFSVLNK